MQVKLKRQNSRASRARESGKKAVQDSKFGNLNLEASSSLCFGS